MNWIPPGWLVYDLPAREIRKRPEKQPTSTATCSSIMDEYQEDSDDSNDDDTTSQTPSDNDDSITKSSATPGPSSSAATNSSDSTSIQKNSKTADCKERQSYKTELSSLHEKAKKENKPFVQKRGGRENSWQENEQIGTT